jgi:hypothetical protein
LPGTDHPRACTVDDSDQLPERFAGLGTIQNGRQHEARACRPALAGAGNDFAPFIHWAQVFNAQETPQNVEHTIGAWGALREGVTALHICGEIGCGTGRKAGSQQRDVKRCLARETLALTRTCQGKYRRQRILLSNDMQILQVLCILVIKHL